MSRERGQCLQVVAHNLCTDILHNGLLGKSGDVLEAEAVLESLEQLGDILPVNIFPVKS